MAWYVSKGYDANSGFYLTEDQYKKLKPEDDGQYWIQFPNEIIMRLTREIRLNDDAKLFKDIIRNLLNQNE